MDTVNYRNRRSRGELRRRSSASLQRKYDYRGVKTAIGFIALGSGALYFLFIVLRGLVRFITG